MSATTFLAVVEIAQEDRVRCSAVGCGHSVYKRVHLVRIDGQTRVYGADCFSRLFGHTAIGRSNPRYGGLDGRALTAEERELLKSNTERLIDMFEREHQAELAHADARRSEAAEPTSDFQNSRRPQGSLFGEAANSVISRSAAEAVARERLGRRYPSVNLDVPGFKWLVLSEIETVIRENVA